MGKQPCSRLVATGFENKVYLRVSLKCKLRKIKLLFDSQDEKKGKGVGCPRDFSDVLSVL